MNLKDIEKLAALSRIELSDTEKGSLLTDMDSILAYVNQIKAAAGTVAAQLQPAAPTSSSRNVFREDANPHQSGIFTEILLESSPDRHGQYIKVKKIL